MSFGLFSCHPGLFWMKTVAKDQTCIFLLISLFHPQKHVLSENSSARFPPILLPSQENLESHRPDDPTTEIHQVRAEKMKKKPED